MSSEQKNYVLGLDIGVNSVGWAAVECESPRDGGDDKPQPVALLDLNSYIFQAGVDEKSAPRNAERRQNRLMRRQIARRACRRRALAKFLKENGLLPREWDAKSPDNPKIANGIDRKFAARSASWSGGDGDEKMRASPFAMRAFGLDDDLEPHEIGRICMHLQKRRGYFSNRGAKYLKLLRHLDIQDPGDESAKTGSGGRKSAESASADAAESDEEKQRKKDTRKVLDGIEKLDAAMKKCGARTLGEYAWKARDAHVARITRGFEEKQSSGKKAGHVERIGFYAKREMTECEFDMLRARQEKASGLPAEKWVKIREMIFEQLPVSPPPRRFKHLRYNDVGSCGVFPHRRRAAKARLESQEFRTRATIANIKADDEPLTLAQRSELFAAANDPGRLNKDGRLPWSEVKKIIKCARVNYGEDKDGKTGLVGNRTARSIADVVGADAWAQMGRGEYLASDARMQKTIAAAKMSGRSQQHSLVEDLLSYSRARKESRSNWRRWIWSRGI